MGDERFTPMEWVELENALMYAFLLVAFADGKLGRLESAMLVKVYESARTLTEPKEQLFRSALGGVESHKEMVLKRAIDSLAPGETSQQKLFEVSRILQKAAEAEALAFKQNLVASAYLIARHSKFRPRVTAQETHAVNEIALSLGLN